MKVQIDAGTLRRTKTRDYVVRFVFGGVITVCTGLVGHRFGPGVSGLFLAFPAILPASLTLVEKHDGRDDARDACRGAALGSLALLLFGFVVWQLLPRWNAAIVLAVATFTWLLTGAGLWAGRFGRISR